MEQAGRHPPTALVVDDDVLIRALLAEVLDEQQFDVHTASNGFSGLRLATEHRPSLVLLDLALPELSGEDVLHELRSSPMTRDAAIIVVTGNPRLLSDRARDEMDGLLAKPFELSALLSLVQHALERAERRRAEARHTGAALLGSQAHQHVRLLRRHALKPHRPRPSR